MNSWLRTSAIALLLWSGASCTDSPVEPSLRESNIAAFEAFWLAFDVTYPYFTYKQVDWRAVHDQYATAAANAGSDAALVSVMRNAVAPLKDLHIWFRQNNGPQQATYVLPRAVNWNQPLWSSYLPRFNWQQKNNWGYGRLGDVGYLVIGEWNTSQVNIAEVDAALEELRDTRAMIIDVRMNPGGNDALAFQVAGRFTTQPGTFGTVQFRNGLGHDDFGTPIPRSVQPRGSWQYTNPVVLLVGRGCVSSTEDFTAAMALLPHITVAGDTTAGGSGNPIEVSIVRAGVPTGWVYSVPRWIERLNDGTIIEWKGIVPQHIVPFSATEAANGKDSVLEWALNRLAPP